MKNRKLITYFCQIPDFTNALEFKAYNKNDARKICLEFLGLSKLPSGSTIYK